MLYIHINVQGQYKQYTKDCYTNEFIVLICLKVFILSAEFSHAIPNIDRHCNSLVEGKPYWSMYRRAEGTKTVFEG